MVHFSFAQVLIFHSKDKNKQKRINVWIFIPRVSLLPNRRRRPFLVFQQLILFPTERKKLKVKKSRSVDKETLSSATSITGSGGVDNVFLITNANRWWMSCQWPVNGSGNLASHSSAKAETWLNCKILLYALMLKYGILKSPMWAALIVYLLTV